MSSSAADGSVPLEEGVDASGGTLGRTASTDTRLGVSRAGIARTAQPRFGSRLAPLIPQRLGQA